MQVGGPEFKATLAGVAFTGANSLRLRLRLKLKLRHRRMIGAEFTSQTTRTNRRLAWLTTPAGWLAVRELRDPDDRGKRARRKYRPQVSAECKFHPAFAISSTRLDYQLATRLDSSRL